MASALRLDVSKDIDRYDRAGTTALGAVLAAAGIARGHVGGYASAATGAVLLARGLTGRCPVTRWQRDHGIGEIRVKKAVTILKPPSDIYSLFRHFELLPEFMLHVRSVTPNPDGTWRWITNEGPMQLQWDAEIVTDLPPQRLEWRSLPGGDVEHGGILELVPEPSGKGTEVHISINYRPPGGVTTAPFRQLFSRVTNTLFATELRRMKQLLEAGEIATGERRGQRAGAALVSPRSEDRYRHQLIAGVVS